MAFDLTFSPRARDHLKALRKRDWRRGNQIMNVVPLEKTNLTLPGAADLAKSGTVILTKNGKPLAAIKHLTGLDWESLALTDNPRFQALIDESRRAYHKEGALSLAQVCQELGLKVKSRAPRQKKSKDQERKKDAREPSGRRTRGPVPGPRSERAARTAHKYCEP
ncbi:MAG TPA: hypothetical protein VG099_04310 [Gemmataceae bacterium]|jgi:hypothetical protein|nr:hypothetical protein [Gemmataceae bacterium]